MKRLGLQPKSKSDQDQAAPEVTTKAETAATGEAAPAGEAEADSAETKGKKRSRPKGQYSLAADLARWRLLCVGAASLTKAEQKIMTEVGWPVERITATAALVEAVAAADIAQQCAIQRKEAGTAEAQRLEKKVRRWYSQAVRRAKDAIDQQDPDNRDHWYKQLGL
jgi:hypothetical protein